jgi:hypothetical protein
MRAFLRGDPHSPQNFCPSGFSWPQEAHVVMGGRVSVAVDRARKARREVEPSTGGWSNWAPAGLSNALIAGIAFEEKGSRTGSAPGVLSDANPG